MTAGRIYVPLMFFNMRIVNMQNVWTPSTEYLGKKQDRPSWFLTAITDKTRQNWWEEPLLAGAWAAYSDLLQRSGMTPQMVTEWPIKDGDMPAEPGKPPAEWAKNRWVLGGSSNQQIKTEIVQNGAVVPLPAKIGVKPGDYVSLGCSAAIKQNNPRALKHFCNTILFTAPGEEIAVGNSISGEELMRTAQAQGLNPVGFGAGVPGGSFPGGGGSPGGFPQGNAQNGPSGPMHSHGNAGGFVPTPGASAPGPGFAGGQPSMNGPGNGSAFPSSPGQQGGGFPGGGFPGR